MHYTATHRLTVQKFWRLLSAFDKQPSGLLFLNTFTRRLLQQLGARCHPVQGAWLNTIKISCHENFIFSLVYLVSLR